jgi:hypothetical protein
MSKVSLYVGNGENPQSWSEFLRQVENAPKPPKPGARGPVENLEKRLTVYLPPDPDRRCDFVSSKTGLQCKKWSMRGASRCHFHGGYRQNPHHKGTQRLYRQGALHEHDTQMKARHALKGIPRQASGAAALAIKENSKPKRPRLVLEGARAYLEEDGGKAWRRWVKSLKETATNPDGGREDI